MNYYCYYYYLKDFMASLAVNELKVQIPDNDGLSVDKSNIYNRLCSL
jgi:hypothetical protein